MGVINWLNSNSGAITGIAAIITAIATVVLVGITAFYAWVTRQMRLDAQKPEIAIFLRPHESSIRFIVLCIQNMGGGPAKNVQFTCTSDAILSPLFIGYIKHGISYFAPSQKIEDIIMDVHGQSAEVMQTPVEITVTYKDSMNKECKNTFPLNFGLYQGVRQMSDPLSGIHESLQSIKQSLSSISQQIKKD